ncbi:Hypothetical protein HVIM_02732 [Roseomonas mucosa]|uniref:RepB-like DNA primase domain-containing protein n=1 Tax=Roseomonas mucosa TaxID=207340 RepID=A0A379N5S8_9PROT|nr:AAA family ATPase [Roseomonas mucosa]QDD95606.1 Hypothetical protein HVIM_02732 [Roseomonas mucosa]SUE41833.1 Uncharacterised protein [Roseomonas mucosa]
MSASEVPAFLQTPANKFDIAIAQSTLDFFEPNAKWNLRTFDDNKSRNKKNLIRTKSNVRPSDCERELVGLNNSGAGIFFVVNEGGHKDEDITRIRSVFIDIDQVVENEQKFFEYFTDIEKIGVVPHLIVRSSPGKFHVYWKVSDLPVAEFSAMQQRLVAYFESDKTVINPSRVMRLPGFAWNKNTPGFFSEVAFKRDGEPFTADQLRAAFPERQPVAVATGAGSLPEGQAAAPAPGNVLPFPAPAASPSGGVAFRFDATAYAPAGSAGNSTRLAEAEAALWAIPPTKGGFWRHAMIALKAEGESGWPVFDRWSAAANDGSYDQRKNRELWDAATAADGGLNLIFTEAQKRGWINPNSNAAKPVQQAPQSNAWQPPKADKLKLEFKMAKDIEDNKEEWLIEKVLEVDSITSVIAASRVGKSFYALAMACSVATGIDFLGDKVMRRSPVFYLAGEGKAGLAKRIRAWANYHDVSMDDIPLFVANRLPAMTEQKNVDETIEVIESLVEAHGLPSLIVIDTLARAFGVGDENSSKDVGIFTSGMDKIKAIFPGCSVLVLHHTGHFNKDRARGSSSIVSNFDGEIFLDRDIEKTKKIDLTIKKLKDQEGGRKMKLILKEQEIPEWNKKSLVVDLDRDIDRETQINMAVSSGLPLRQCVENLKRDGISIGINTIMERRREYEAQRNLNGV